MSNKTTLKGFTLIELLVVLVIISIILGFALLASGDFGKTRRIQTTAERLQRLIALGSQQAILEPATLGIKFNKQQIEFYRFVIDNKHPQGQWQLITDDNLFKLQYLPKKLFLTIKTQAQNKKQPQIIISPNGDITPFVLNLGVHGQTPLYQLAGELNGDVALRQL